MKNLWCKLFGHNYTLVHQDDMPSSNLRVSPGYGGGSLSLRCIEQCQRCGYRHEFRTKWD